jgi:hypothetical protein
MAAGKCSSWQRYDRNAHPQRFAGGHPPRVRERIQRDIHCSITPEKVCATQPLLKRKPLSVYPALLEPTADALLHLRHVICRIYERDAGTRLALQHACPQAGDVPVDLGRVVKGGKCQRPVIAGWRRGYRQRLRRWIEAEQPIRQAHNLLDIVALFARRNVEPIGNDCIHRAETRSSGIAGPGNLHGCGLTCEGEKSARSRVSGEVNENVDPVPFDLRRQSSIRPFGRVSPAAHTLFESDSDGVVGRDPGVCHDFDFRGVQGFDHSYREIADRMCSKVAGNETEAESPVRVGR